MKTLIILFLLVFFKTYSQSTIYQDVFQGGVTVAGTSNGVNLNSFNSNISVNIPIASSIRKAFLIFYGTREPDDIFINFNGDSYNCSENSEICRFLVSTPAEKVTINLLDVSASINSSQNNYSIQIPDQTNTNFSRYSCFNLVILYENLLSNVINISLVINQQDLITNSVNYNITGLNPIDFMNDISLAIQSDILWDTSTDGTKIFIEGNEIGIIGGEDFSNIGLIGAGVKGHFYYQNGSLFGLDDDTADSFVSESDGLAIINNYLTAGVTNIQLKLETQSAYNIFNNYISFPIVYSSPCDTFTASVSNETTICQGETLQLNVTGGQTYEWLPTTGLSCTDCPNPIFSGDSSLFYTVRIWNNDSCSVVRPLKINVRPKPEFGAITTQPSECGTNNGSVVLLSANDTQDPISYTLNGGPSEPSGIFSSLGSGVNTFQLQDGFGCFSEDTIVFVPEINNTVASFSVSPNYGTAPLTVQTNNTSQNATDYWWWVNEIDQGNNLSSFSCDTSGNYTFELIAWQYDPSCADTSIQTVNVLDKLLIPTAFTPDNDGINETWELPYIDEIYPNSCVRIYDRWGGILFTSDQGKYSIQPWNGKFKDEYLSTGSYYFIIETNDQNKQIFKGILSILK